MLRDLSPEVGDNAILEFLKDQPGISVKSGNIFCRIRDSYNLLSSFSTGDRYARWNVKKHALSRLIDHNKCRVWHEAERLITPPPTLNVVTIILNAISRHLALNFNFQSTPISGAS